jgi:hypothetical protein
MIENTIRITPEKGNKSKQGASGSSASMFSGFERKLKLESWFEEGFPVQYLPKVLFVMMLLVIYIGNTHYGERTTREINKSQSEVEDLRADYTTLKADLMFASKQSEVARRTRDMGLQESLKPPYKIVVEKGEY